MYLSSSLNISPGLISNSASFFPVQGFKFTMAISRQMESLREANLNLRSQLEEARVEVSRANKRVDPLLRAAQEAKENEQAALKERDQMKQAYGSELVRSAQLQADNGTLRARITMLEAENGSLRDAVQDASKREDETFDLGYFTACYEAAQGLPADLDLQSHLGWDRKLIRERASRFQSTGSSQEDPVRRGPDTDPAAMSDDPLNVPAAISAQRKDPERATDIIHVEDDSAAADL